MPVAQVVRGTCRNKLRSEVEYMLKHGTSDNSYLVQVCGGRISLTSRPNCCRSKCIAPSFLTQYLPGLFRPSGCPEVRPESLCQSSGGSRNFVQPERGNIRAGRKKMARKQPESSPESKASGQTSGHARKFPQSPEEPWYLQRLDVKSA
jgi:hypothetical protein